MNAIQPMVTIGIRLPVPHYERLIELAQERGLVTSKGRPNLSAVGREMLAEVLEPDQGEEAEGGNGDNE